MARNIRMMLATVIAACLLIAPDVGWTHRHAKAEEGVKTQTSGDSGNISTSTEIDDLIGTLCTRLGPLGILGWYLWFDISKVHPRKDAELVKALAEFKAEAAAAREAAREDLQCVLTANNNNITLMVSEWRDRSEKWITTVEDMIRNCAARRAENRGGG